MLIGAKADALSRCKEGEVNREAHANGGLGLTGSPFGGRITVYMKNPLRPVFAMGVACSLLVGCNNGSDDGLGSGGDFGSNDPNVVLVVGDSISVGGYSGAANWPSRFAGMVGKTVVNKAVGGTTSGEGAARIRGLLSSVKPGYVIIFYGANDAIQGVGTDSTIGALNAMADAARANKTIPVVGNVMPMASWHGVFNGRVDAINGRMSEVNAKRVNTYGAIISDPASYLVRDGLHPNDLGEMAIAMEFADAF